MWSNPSWQETYIKQAIKAFDISQERLNYALVVKSINQAHLWGGGNLAKIQIENCMRGLNGQILSRTVV